MRKVVIAMVGAVLFGVLAGAARSAGSVPSSASFYAWSTLANLSAPWLLLPFLAGSIARRVRDGALIGLVVTGMALLAFYATVGMAQPLDGRTGPAAASSWALANQVYFQAGLVTGPLLGALGVAWQRRSQSSGGRLGRVGAGWLAALLLAGEPLVLLALGYASPLSTSWRAELPPLLSLPLMWGLTLDRPAATLLVYAIELVAGLALLVIVALHDHRSLRPLA